MLESEISILVVYFSKSESVSIQKNPNLSNQMFRAFESSIWDSPFGLNLILKSPCELIGLPHLAEVIHITILTGLASFLLQHFSHYLSPKLFPNTYPKLKAKQHDWDLHIVSKFLILNSTENCIILPFFSFVNRLDGLIQ